MSIFKKFKIFFEVRKLYVKYLSIFQIKKDKSIFKTIPTSIRIYFEWFREFKWFWGLAQLEWDRAYLGSVCHSSQQLRELFF
jgi:hypothetical protein